MVEEFIIQSELGDEYKLRISSDNSWMLNDEFGLRFKGEGIEIVDIELQRSKGINATSRKVLSKIEECIADFFLRHREVIICFYCDFISLVPSQRKKMPVQEYRSRLFSAMFDRYVAQHHLNDVYNNVVQVKGIAETFYFHIIYRQEHQKYAEMLSGVQIQNYGKPEE